MEVQEIDAGPDDGEKALEDTASSEEDDEGEEAEASLGPGAVGGI